MTQTPHPRITPIDALRGIAALFVANFHFSFVTGHVPQGGYMCVDLFFILSGIILTHVYGTKIVLGHITFRHFLINRLARLYPLHLITFLLMVPITLVLMRHEIHWTSFLFKSGLNLVLLQNVGLTPDELPINVPSWSISTEIVINILWFLGLVVLRRPLLWFSLMIVASLALLFFGNGYSYDINCGNVFFIFNGGLLRCLSGFLLGCLVYRWCIGSNALQRVPVPLMNGVCLATLAALVAVLYQHARWVPLFGDYLIVLVLFPLLILGSLHHGAALHRLLQLRPLCYLGDISYSVYLLHWPLGTLLVHAQLRLPGIPHLIWTLAFFAILLPLSALSLRLIEMPLRNAFRYKSKTKVETKPGI